MKTISGRFINGIFMPDEGKVPENARAVAVFEGDDDQPMVRPPRKKMTSEEAKAFLDKFQGCLAGIDPEEERQAYLNEKYGLTN